MAAPFTIARTRKQPRCRSTKGYRNYATYVRWNSIQPYKGINLSECGEVRWMKLDPDVGQKGGKGIVY